MFEPCDYEFEGRIGEHFWGTEPLNYNFYSLRLFICKLVISDVFSIIRKLSITIDKITNVHKLCVSTYLCRWFRKRYLLISVQ